MPTARTPTKPSKKDRLKAHDTLIKKYQDAIDQLEAEKAKIEEE